MNFQKSLDAISKDKRYLTRYVNFIQKRVGRTSVSGYTEKHHILPVSLFPEARHLPDNLIVLSGREHYIAHWMLAKCTRSPSMWFAFNQMRRIGKSSILYEYAREEISTMISKSNRGRKRTSQHIQALKDSIKGKSPARLVSTNHYCWLDKNDQRWVTGEAVPAALGRKHTDKTKNKIGKANQGKKYFVNSEGNVRLFDPNNVSAGYVTYSNPDWFEPKCVDTVWVHHPETKHQLRVTNNQVPIGYVLGRIKGGGWSDVNQSNKRKYINLITKQYDFLLDSQVQSYHVRFDGNSISKINILIYKNHVVIGNKNMLTFLNSHNIMIDQSELKKQVIGKPHHNNDAARRSFREINQGKSFEQLDIQLVRLEDFTMKDEYEVQK